MTISKVLLQQRRIRFLVVGGVLSMLGSIPMFFLGGGLAIGAMVSTGRDVMVGVWLSVLMALGGAVALGWGLVLGVKYRDGVGGKAQYGVFSNAYVISRFIVGPTNEIISETDYLEDMPNKFMVRLAMPDGRRLEMSTAPEVYFTIPEAAVGTVYHRGTWITRFEMVPQTERPYVPPSV